MGTLFGIAIGIVLGGFAVAFYSGAKTRERETEAFDAGRKSAEALILGAHPVQCESTRESDLPRILGRGSRRMGQAVRGVGGRRAGRLPGRGATKTERGTDRGGTEHCGIRRRLHGEAAYRIVLQRMPLPGC